MPHRRKLTGEVFGLLTVLGMSVRTDEKSKWVCQCKCGKTTTVFQQNLIRLHTRSCGCLNIEVSTSRVITHGYLAGGIPPEYGIWSTMKSRCFNPNSQEFFRYGARGITVCESWRKSFAEFFRDMGPKPSKAHSLEREDNDGNYEPGNCRWATSAEQLRNRRCSVLLEHEGQRKTLTELAAISGIKEGTIRSRVFIYGWSLDKALTAPLNKTKGHKR